MWSKHWIISSDVLFLLILDAMSIALFRFSKPVYPFTFGLFEPKRQPIVLMIRKMENKIPTIRTYLFNYALSSIN